MRSIACPACLRLLPLLIGLTIGWAVSHAEEGAVGPAPHPPELRVLDRWRGSWDVEARRRVPQPATITYIDQYEWALGGRFIRGQAGPKSDGSASTSMATYDPQLNAYRFWSFDSSGLAFELIPAHWDEASRTMKWDGGLFSPVSITGRVQFVDDDTIRWSSLLKDWKRTVILDVEGTSTRRR